jgi:hypothetical protein
LSHFCPLCVRGSTPDHALTLWICTRWRQFPVYSVLSGDLRKNLRAVAKVKMPRHPESESF